VRQLWNPRRHRQGGQRQRKTGVFCRNSLQKQENPHKLFKMSHLQAITALFQGVFVGIPYNLVFPGI